MKSVRIEKFPTWTFWGLLVLICVSAGNSFADEYPSKTIRVVVDSAPGGISDIWARRLAVHMSRSLGQSVIVDNKPGASGTLAADEITKSAPDGYTVLFGGQSGVIVYPNSGGSVKYDPQKDFTPAAIAAQGHPILAISSSSGVHNLRELLAFAAKHPEGLTCGTSGIASPSHFACALVSRALGVNLRSIPYKGSAPAILDAAGGQINLAIGYNSEIEPLIVSGRLTALAAFAKFRTPRFPSLPTFEELGYPNMEFTGILGFFFPAKTPSEIVNKLNQASIQAMRQPDSIDNVRLAGTVFTPLSPNEFSGFVLSEQTKWKRLSDELNIKVER